MDLETALMLRVADGDGGAMDVLFRHAYPEVRSLCARLSLDHAAADDLAQETFMRVLRSAATFRGDAAFSTWVYRIARNVCHDHLMKQTRERSALRLHRHEPSASERSDAERVDCVRRALRELSHEDREAVVLSRLRDLPYRRLAEILECGEGAARVRVRRALRRLREILQRMEQADVM